MMAKMAKIISDSKRIKEKAHFHASRLAGAVHRVTSSLTIDIESFYIFSFNYLVKVYTNFLYSFFQMFYKNSGSEDDI